jgi:hypothetical protein
LCFLIPDSRILEDIVLGNIIAAITLGSEYTGNLPLDPLEYQNVQFEDEKLFACSKCIDF